MSFHDLNESDEFLRYPTNSLVAVFDNAEDLAGALRALNLAGYVENDVDVLSGHEGAKRLDITGREHGLLARIYRIMESAALESKNLREFAQELEAGHFVVVVRTTDKEERNDLWSILHVHGGHRATFYGRWIIEKIA
jgi:hypothetical protein